MTTLKKRLEQLEDCMSPKRMETIILKVVYDADSSHVIQEIKMEREVERRKR